MAALMKYDQARTALAEAKSLREVKVITDKMTALKEYARRAKDKDLELMAQEMRLRAERKFGELSLQLETSKGGRPRNNGKVATVSTQAKKDVLAELGVDQRHANRCEKLAEENMDEEEFEEKVAASIERIKNPPKRKRVAPKKVDPETTRRMLEPKTECDPARAAYLRKVKVGRSVFTACREIREANATPVEWLDCLYPAEVDDIEPEVFPVIDWLI